MFVWQGMTSNAPPNAHTVALPFLPSFLPSFTTTTTTTTATASSVLKYYYLPVFPFCPWPENIVK